MKKLYSLLFALSIFMMGAGLFYSCEWWTVDDEIVYNLEGTWRGDMYFASYYDGKYYYSNYTTLEFVERDYNRGEGYWLDEYSNAPWDYVANHFTWEVRGGVIYIRLLEDNYYVEIRDFDIDRRRFSGYVYYEGEERHFDLYHVASPNWNSYDYGWDYDYGYGPGYYYSPRRMKSDDADSLKAEAPVELKERPKRVLMPAVK